MMGAVQLRRGHRTSNAIIYFEELLDEQNRQKTESTVERMDGVLDAHFNETQRQLMIIDYDPTRTNSEAILNRIKRQHSDAQLI